MPKRSPQSQLDLRALEAATQALQKMNDHEAICSSRWGLAIKLLWTVVGGVFGTMAVVIGYLGNLVISAGRP